MRRAPRHSDVLRGKVEPVLETYALPGRLLLEHPEASDLCGEYFTILSHIPRTAVPLMEVALGQARELAATGDDVAAALADYLERHIVEEMHGDEPGGEAIEDLRVLGVDVEAALRRPAPPKIAQLVGAQYFYALHGHPVAVLGYMWVIEVNHPRRAAVERLVTVTGLPRAGFSQLFEHAVLDIEHARELETVLDALPLTDAHHELIGLSALLTIQLSTEALMEVVARDRTPASPVPA